MVMKARLVLTRRFFIPVLYTPLYTSLPVEGERGIVRLMVVKDKEKEKDKVSLKVIGLGALVAVMVGVVSLTVFFYGQWQRVRNNPLQAQEEKAQRDIAEVMEAVGKLMVLPENEVPTLVVIDDKENIGKDQEFFKWAENGDQMLIYRQAKKAILYRSSSNKIVNVAPVSEREDEVEEASPGGEIAL